MEGGHIVRRIGGESIKRAKQTLILEATHDDLTLYSPKGVVMIGEQGGVEFHNDYKPPEPLKVTKLEGPFTEEGEKVAVVEKGKSYKFRITQFNHEVERPAELKKTKWAIQFNEEKPMPVAEVMGKQEVTLIISETEISDKITIYAYISNRNEEGKSDANLKVKTGGINTRFYDEQGQQIYEIPQKLHKAFNEEYGICLAYDKENEMLYYDGECTPAYEKTSPTAIKYWKKELDREQTSKGKLLFGYKLGFKIVAEPSDNTGDGYSPYSLDDFDDNGNVLNLKKEEGAVSAGIVPGIPKVNMTDWNEKEKKQRQKNNNFIPDTIIIIGDIAFIDLDDFDNNLNQKGFIYIYRYKHKYELCKIEFPNSDRYFNLPRILEHEFLGHALLKLSDERYPIGSMEEQNEGPVPVEAKLCNVIRREIGIPDRTKYTTQGKNYKSIDFGYLNGSDEPDKEITIYDPEWGEYRSIYSPPKFPLTHGEFELYKENIDKLSTVKYYKTIKYDVYKKTFDFS